MAKFQSYLRVTFAVVVLICAAQAMAQGSARIEGIVTDNTGGALPGTTVTATHLATNVARTVVSEKDGAYTITPLPVGGYRVQFELSGFKTATVPVTLTVDQVARVDIKLELGGVSETVTVVAAAPVIEKTTSYIGTLIAEEMVENL